MSAFNEASPVERFKISEIAIKRMMRRRWGVKRKFEWAAFVALREKIAQKRLRGPSKLQRITAKVYNKLVPLETLLRQAALKVKQEVLKQLMQLARSR